MATFTTPEMNAAARGTSVVPLQSRRTASQHLSSRRDPPPGRLADAARQQLVEPQNAYGMSRFGAGPFKKGARPSRELWPTESPAPTHRPRSYSRGPASPLFKPLRLPKVRSAGAAALSDLSVVGSAVHVPSEVPSGVSPVFLSPEPPVLRPGHSTVCL